MLYTIVKLLPLFMVQKFLYKTMVLSRNYFVSQFLFRHIEILFTGISNSFHYHLLHTDQWKNITYRYTLYHILSGFKPLGSQKETCKPSKWKTAGWAFRVKLLCEFLRIYWKILVSVQKIWNSNTNKVTAIRVSLHNLTWNSYIYHYCTFAFFIKRVFNLKTFLFHTQICELN